MFNSTSLKSVLIVVTAAVLMVGCERAPGNEGNGVTMEFVRIPAGKFIMGVNFCQLAIPLVNLVEAIMSSRNIKLKLLSLFTCRLPK